MFSRGFRRVASRFCLAAMAMQLALPSARIAHEIAHHSTDAVVELTWSLHASLPGDEGSPSHDSAACPVCRTNAQSKSLAPAPVYRAVAVVDASWLERLVSRQVSSQVAQRTAPARAPPLLA